MERLVRIKGFHMKKPVVRIAVGFKKFKTTLEYFVKRQILRTAHGTAVHHILTPYTAKMIGKYGIGDIGFPAIAFLATYKFSGIVAVVIGASAVFPVVLVVADEMDYIPLCFSISGMESSNGSIGPQLRCKKLYLPVWSSRRAGIQGKLPA